MVLANRIIANQRAQTPPTRSEDKGKAGKGSQWEMPENRQKGKPTSDKGCKGTPKGEKGHKGKEKDAKSNKGKNTAAKQSTKPGKWQQR